MTFFCCYSCGAYIFIPEVEHEDDDCSDCCDFPSWVTYETKKRAEKNLKVLKNKMQVFGIFLSEYKSAKERVKYAPGGAGYKEAKHEFETIATISKKRPLEENTNPFETSKKIKQL